jgi:CxxC motif-containing protein
MSESSVSVVKVIRCIVCPTGCQIQAISKGSDVVFEGYTCERGLEYAKQEFYEPKRILTTTIRVDDGFLPLLPVRTDKPILKDRLREVLDMIAKTVIKAPVKMGDILIENILELDSNIIASRDLAKL